MAFTSSGVIWSWSISLITSAPPSTTVSTFLRPSSGPFTAQRNFASSGGAVCCRNGPETKRRGPEISPRSMRFFTATMSSSGAPRSRAVVTPAISSSFAEIGMTTSRHCEA